MYQFTRLYPLFILIFCYSHTIAQDSTQSLTQDEINTFIEKAGKLLIDKYVFEDIGKEVADHIRQRHLTGNYNTVTDAVEFAQIITTDMQAISNDKHMRVRLNRRGRDRNPDQLMDQYLQQQRRHADNYGFRKVEILDDNIGYLDFRYFASPAFAADRVEAVMNFLRYSDALIFDMRKNGGGNPRLIQLICSYLFRDKVHLNSLYWREGDRTDEFWTLDHINGKRMPDVPVFVLTSQRTFSGAEEFTYNLKTRNRATIIGETTGGGANPGGSFSLTEKFRIFIPTGRAINPVTGTNWEGTGVEPDIPVSSDQAMDTAVTLATAAAETYRARKMAEAQKFIDTVHSAVNKAEIFLQNQDPDQAFNIITKAFDVARSGYVVDEGSINTFGYHFLNQDKNGIALLIFKYNVAAYPDAFNTYDSLGEAYMKSGQNELAVANYQKSLELNPQNHNAVRMLEKLRSK